MAKMTDPYMARVLVQTDPIVRKAQECILQASRDVLDAKDRLYWASKDLERHPDFIKTERARRKGKPVATCVTLAWWVHNTIASVLENATLEDAGDWLLEDSNPRRAAASLRLFVDEGKRDLELAARRRTAKGKGKGLELVPSPQAA